ncbi:MAG: alpha-amylase [Cyanobacteria bacterium SBLK]|nr:alpha-amylase [Cyanobacteria bacterium SBLK]
MSVSSQYLDVFSPRVRPLLEKVYPQENIEQLIEKLFTSIAPYCSQSVEENLNKWSENTVMLITYGDTIINNSEKPLITLNRFLKEYLREAIAGVHILPFYPYSSDDGFSVIDYLAVNSELGTWEDISPISENFELMFDLVLNHISSESEWFQQFKQGKEPGCNYFITADPKTDISQVVRPRTNPLLMKVETPAGEKHVWATFSHDQIDLNFANPEVLLEFIKIILFYVKAGAKYIRLDAVAYLWKQLDTTCIHLFQTHALIRVLREILQMVNPNVALLTETNVPNRENLSYFGNRNEAHMIYNFSLPPLVLHALLQGKSDYLKTWMMSMPPAPLGCAYFNFLSSHDGIGLRPAEGLLSDDEFQGVVDTIKKFGGEIGYRTKPDGSQGPYEANITYFDALKGTIAGEDEWQIQRFICAHTIMMSLEGIPAFYIHSLLATPNDYEEMKRTGRRRSINRHRWDEAKLKQLLDDGNSSHAIVLRELSRLIQIRRKQNAFHPNATQYTLHPLNKALFVFWRQSMARDQSIFSIHNLSDRPQILELSTLNLVLIDPWRDLISGKTINDIGEEFILEPYQSAWITNKF